MIGVKTVRILFRRSTDAKLFKANRIYKKNEIVCILDEDQISKIDDTDALENVRAKYKIGDGKTRYRNLPFEEGTIPVVINVTIDTGLKDQINKLKENGFNARRSK